MKPLFHQILAPGAALALAASALAQLDPAVFQRPPADCRPMTWMHLMNGNASEAGLLKDLQALADAGVGGALIFSVSSPDIPEGKVRFNSPEFRSILVSGAKEAERLGLKIGVHNCDGWTSSGGPWIKPEDSMKRVVWSETVIRGGEVEVTVPLGRVSAQSKLAEAFMQSCIAPDFRVAEEPHAMFIHRRVGDADAYCFHSSKLETRTLRASMTSSIRFFQMLNLSGSFLLLPAFTLAATILLPTL